MHEPRRTVIEVVVILALGVTIALTANAMNSEGLKLGRDYFFDGVTSNDTRSADTKPAADPAATTASNPASAAQHTDDPLAGLPDEVRQQLKNLRLTPIHQPQVKELFESPMYAGDVYVIIDARPDKDYEEGHIPGAHLLDYYKETQYTPLVLPFTQMAEKVIVYCNGGNCDDSIHTAAMLRDAYGVDPAKIFVFTEGFEGWKSAGLPIEKGARNSGDISTDTTTKGAAK